MNYPHDSIPDGVRAIEELGREHHFSVAESKDPSEFRDVTLQDLDVIVFLNNSGDILDVEGKQALQRFVRSGRGIVGIHGAAATMEDWPWYVELIGGTFKSHPPIQAARVTTVDPSHPSTLHLPAAWMWEEEWYNFQKLSPGIRVLLSVDESSYAGGENGPLHPVSWTQEYEGSRVFYTAIGHQASAFVDPRIRQHLLRGLLWAGGKIVWEPGLSAPSAG